MMKAKIKIQMDNSAFAEEPTIELARILYDLSIKIDGESWEHVDNLKLRDINGNTVGVLEITEED